ncbi:MAG: 2-oxo-hepta-3-ene-1,7-dioic acid hydratase, partial [Boseongicola sp. SB0676_bin_33]|nr:2-oxo-hepta-3-ene-1,7-dioic acid hydratase [Boseongicola sp. SB0676_bin_33]
MTPEEHASAAAVLLRAEETMTQIGLLSLAHPNMTMDDAYAIQNELLSAKIARGRQVAGWKIGLTSKAMQAALNIDVPDSGILFDDMEFANGSEVPAGRFIQPRIEAEIAFIMKNAVGGQDVTREDVLSATECVAPVLEILDTRIQRADPASGRTRI